MSARRWRLRSIRSVGWLRLSIVGSQLMRAAFLSDFVERPKLAAGDSIMPRRFQPSVSLRVAALQYARSVTAVSAHSVVIRHRRDLDGAFTKQTASLP